MYSDHYKYSMNTYNLAISSERKKKNQKKTMKNDAKGKQRKTLSGCGDHGYKCQGAPPSRSF